MPKTIVMGGSSKSSFDALLDQELQQQTQEQQDQQQQWVQIKRALLALRQELQPWQLQMLTRKDENGNPSLKKAAVMTRRSGKTYEMRHEAAEAVADHPWLDTRKAQPVVQYIAQTQKKALDTFWTPFKNICERVGMLAHWDDANLRATFSNGVLVRASGVDTGFDIEKYRGDAYVLVIMDEAASYGPKVERLIVEGLGMAMADYNGVMVLVGTPGPTEAGYFYEVYKKLRPGWTIEPCASFMNNPHLPAEVRTLEWVERNLGPLDSPKVRREAFGEWVTDSSTLVYSHYRADNNSADVLPAGHEWQFLCGLDLGWRDPSAFVVGAFAKTHPHLFVVHAESHSHMLPAQIYQRLEELQARFHFKRIVADLSGSTTIGLVTEWNQRGKFGIIGANKKPGYKATAIEHLNSDLWQGKIKLLPAAASLAAEWRVLPWHDAEEKEDKQKSVRHEGKQKEHPGFANHESDACLYMFLESRHFRGKFAEVPALPGTPDYWRQQQLKAKQDAFTKARSKQHGFKYHKL